MGNGRTNSSSGGLNLSQKQMTLKSAGAISKGQYVYGRITPPTLSNIKNTSPENYNDCVVTNSDYALSYVSYGQTYTFKAGLESYLYYTSGIGAFPSSLFIPIEDDSTGVSVAFSQQTRSVSNGYTCDTTVSVVNVTRNSTSKLTTVGTAGSLKILGTETKSYSSDWGLSESKQYSRVTGFAKLNDSNYILMVYPYGCSASSMKVLHLKKTSNKITKLTLVYEIDITGSYIRGCKNVISKNGMAIITLPNNKYVQFSYNSVTDSISKGSEIAFFDLSSNEYKLMFDQLSFDEKSNNFIIRSYFMVNKDYRIQAITVKWELNQSNPSSAQKESISPPFGEIKSDNSVVSSPSRFTYMVFTPPLSILNFNGIKVYPTYRRTYISSNQIDTEILASVSMGHFGGVRSIITKRFSRDILNDNSFNLCVISTDGKITTDYHTGTTLNFTNSQIKVSAESPENIDVPIGIALSSTTQEDQDITISLLE